MARLFDDGSSQYLSHASAVVTDVPYTMACWFYLDAAVNGVFMSVGDEGDTTSQTYLRAPGNASVGLRRAWGSNIDANTTAGFDYSTWNHACGVVAAIDDTAVFLNGGNKGTNVVSVAHPADFDITYIGRRMDATWFMSGMIAEAAIWNVALTDAEIKLLAMGKSPLLVRRGNLVFYAPLTYRSRDFDIVGRLNMTATNSPSWAEHPSGLTYPEPMPAMIGEQTPLFWVEPIPEEGEAGETLSIAVTPSDSQFWKTGVKIVG